VEDRSVKASRYILACIVFALAAGSLAGLSEGWRLANAQKEASSWGYGNINTYYNYAFCYDSQSPGGLDSLCVTYWQMIEFVEGEHSYLHPFQADFWVDVSPTSYTVRSAWLDPDFNDTRYIRQYTRATNGRWLEDNLFSAAGTLLLRKQYIYDAQGRVGSIRLTDHEPANGPIEWLIEFSYDAAGKRINQYIYRQLDSGAWYPSSRCIYNYKDSVIPANYRVTELAPFICRKWDYEGVEVFSDAELDIIYFDTYNGSAWARLYNQVYWDYWFDGTEFTAGRAKQWPSGDYESYYSYSARFNADGMRVKDSHNTTYADAFISKTITYTWEPVEDTASHDDLATPAPLRLEAYPNPFVGSLELRCEEPVLNLSVYDLRGRLISSLPVSSQSINWDALDPLGRSFPAGIYFIRAVTSRGVVTRKVIKLRS